MSLENTITIVVDEKDVYSAISVKECENLNGKKYLHITYLKDTTSVGMSAKETTFEVDVVNEYEVFHHGHRILLRNLRRN